MDKTEGFQCLGHSNWIICSPLSQFQANFVLKFFQCFWGNRFLIIPEAKNELVKLKIFLSVVPEMTRFPLRPSPTRLPFCFRWCSQDDRLKCVIIGALSSCFRLFEHCSPHFCSCLSLILHLDSNIHLCCATTTTTKYNSRIP